MMMMIQHAELSKHSTNKTPTIYRFKGIGNPRDALEIVCQISQKIAEIEKNDTKRFISLRFLIVLELLHEILLNSKHPRSFPEYVHWYGGHHAGQLDAANSQENIL